MYNLPPLNGLRAFEAAARHLSFAKAAEELNVTPGAVSHQIRTLDLKKQPSISETLDWVRAMVVMNVDDLDDAVVKETLAAICKYEGDLRKAEKELAKHSEKKKAAAKASEPGPAETAASA